MFILLLSFLQLQCFDTPRSAIFHLHCDGDEMTRVQTFSFKHIMNILRNCFSFQATTRTTSQRTTQQKKIHVTTHTTATNKQGPSLPYSVSITPPRSPVVTTLTKQPTSHHSIIRVTATRSRMITTKQPTTYRDRVHVAKHKAISLTVQQNPTHKTNVHITTTKASTLKTSLYTTNNIRGSTKTLSSQHTNTFTTQYISSPLQKRNETISYSRTSIFDNTLTLTLDELKALEMCMLCITVFIIFSVCICCFKEMCIFCKDRNATDEDDEERIYTHTKKENDRVYINSVKPRVSITEDHSLFPRPAQCIPWNWQLIWKNLYYSTKNVYHMVVILWYKLFEFKIQHARNRVCYFCIFILQDL